MKSSPARSRESRDAKASAAPIAAAEIQNQLNQILASQGFRRSVRLQRFLRITVERALAGDAEQMKEYTLGRDVFDRGADYDPRLDSIVRVEAQRLRRKLREYYQSQGRTDPIVITLPSGSYIPEFARAEQPHPALVRGEPERTVIHAHPDPHTVAVLPFSNLSLDPEQQYFCDGITEDIINALAPIPELRVIGRTSMFAMRQLPPDPHEVGARLGAGTIVEGTVRKSGDLLRVSVKIIDSETRQVRWSNVFDRSTKDVFSIEDEIAHSIAGTLRVTLGAAWTWEQHIKAPNTEAYVLFLKGRQGWNQLSRTGYQIAIEQFSRAISLYPDFAPPYAGLADTYTWLAMWGLLRPREALPKSKQAALDALRLDPASAQAHSSLGAALCLLDWEWREGVLLLRKAIDLQPSYLDGHHLYSLCLLILGRFDEALPHLERAVHLDPLSFRMSRTLGALYYMQGRSEEAEKLMRAAIALEPRSMESRYLLVRVFLQQEKYADALKEAMKCQTDPPAVLALSILGVCLVRNGDRAGAHQALEKLTELSSIQYVDPLMSAFLHTALGNADAAFECLEKSLEERSPHALFLRGDPLLDGIRSDPRFQALVSTLKF